MLQLVNLVLRWRYEWTLAHVSETDARGIPEPTLLTRPWEPEGTEAAGTEPAPTAPPEPDHFATPDELREFFGGSLRYTPT